MMSKKAKAARALERKILRAIERGEFVPAFGYLSDRAYVETSGRIVAHLGESGRTVSLGPCGCALAAAASVNGLDSKQISDRSSLLTYLSMEAGIKMMDAMLLEVGYERSGEPDDRDNPYFRVGQRLRRFHPAMDGYAQ